MSRVNLLVVLLGFLLVATPFVKQQFVLADNAEPSDDVDDSEKDVFVLTSENFDSAVKEAKFALVEFYAPWCGHCKSLKPQYAKAATILKDYDNTILLGKVDATVEPDLASKFSIQGYPTLKWFVNGELVSDYSGGRDTEGIVNWIKKKSGPAAVSVQSVEELHSLEASNPVVFVGFFEALEGPAYDIFIDVAQKVEGVSFAQTTSAEVAAELGLDAPNSVVALKNFAGEPREILPFSDSNLDADTLAAFVAAEKLPLTIEFSQENSDKIFNSGIPKQVILWAKPEDLTPESSVYKTFREVAKVYKGKLIFVTTNNEGPGANPVGSYFGLAGAPGPAVVGFQMTTNKKHKLPPSAEFSLEVLDAFAGAVLDGSAPAEYKSAPVPENNRDGHVVVVVGKTFDAIVKDPTKDVLLEIYAPWCGHCKKLDPVYKKLAKRFASAEDVVIAKMDGTENEHPDVQVQGFPTILFFPAGQDKQAVPLSGGERTLASLTKFIKENAQTSFNLPKKGGKDEL